MSWIGYKSQGVCLLTFLFLFGLFSCNETENETTQLEKSSINKNADTTDYMSEAALIRSVEANLGISATENYTIDIFYKYINSDTLLDAVILVNRKEYAYNQVMGTKSENIFEKTGHSGRYNYIFVRLGGQRNLIETTPIGSNVNFPLTIHFLDLTSVADTDFYVEYRIKNSLRRNYYTVRNSKIYLTFNCPIFDEIGEENPTVYAVRHEMSSVRLSKDISMFEASIEGYNPSKIDDVNTFTPDSIISSDKLFAYFIFDEKKMKFVTPMRPKE